MKKHPLFRNLFTVMAAMLLFVACQEDVYEGPEVPQIPDEPNVEINWSTYTTTKLSVIVDDEYNGAYYYTVEAYANNPMIDTNAKMITGSGQKTNSKLGYNREIVIPDALETLYVQVTDPFMRKRVYAVEVKEGTITLNIENHSAQMRSDYLDAASLKADETPTIDYTYGEGYEELSGNGKVQMSPGNVYVVKANTTFSGELAFGAGNVKVYVEGTLIWNDKSSSIQDKSDLYILDGGVLESSGLKELRMVKESKFAVQAGGKIGSAESSFVRIATTDDALFVNEGDVYVNEFYMSAKSKVFNESTMIINDLETRDTSNPIVNNGVITTTDLTLTNGRIYNASSFEVTNVMDTNGATIDNTNSFVANKVKMVKGVVNNSCKFLMNSLEVNGTTINITAAGYIYAETTTKAGGMKLNMDQHAIWDGEFISFTTQANTITGGESGYALFRVKDIECKGKESITYTGKIEVEYKTHSDNPSWGYFYILANGAAMTSETASVEIPASACNNNTGNNNPGEGDGDIDDGFVEPTTLSYLYMFEDQWPAAGDYDMNDLVMLVELRNITEGASTTGVDVYAELYAVGGTIKLGAGFQLDGIAAGNVSGAEPEQDYAVMQLFSDAHATLGAASTSSAINTYRIDHDPVSIKKSVKFNTPIDKTITVNNFNLFVLVDGNFGAAEWKEIHLPGFKGTSKAIKDEKSTADYIDVETGWMWGLCVPRGESVYYPLETVAINDAYNGFSSWVNGEEAPGWYYNPKPDKVIVFE